LKNGDELFDTGSEGLPLNPESNADDSYFQLWHIRDFGYGDNAVLNALKIWPNSANNIANQGIDVANGILHDAQYISDKGLADYGKKVLETNINWAKNAAETANNFVKNKPREVMDYLTATDPGEMASDAANLAKKVGKSLISAKTWEQTATMGMTIPVEECGIKLVNGLEGVVGSGATLDGANEAGSLITNSEKNVDEAAGLANKTDEVVSDVDGPKKTAIDRKLEVKIRNRHLAGKKHLNTDVPFDVDGFPIFESTHDVKIPKKLNSPDIVDSYQFKHATKDLKQTLEENPILKSNFTDEQLKAIEKGNAKIPDYTWHHHQDGKTLQLVDQTLHSKTGHTGGRAVTGGRP
jgi:DNase/tRNase domain of colicin-like bacteriocin